MRCLFSLWLACLCSLPVLAAPKVITLVPHLTEMAYAAGMGDQLIAVSDYSDYPSKAKTLPRVASFQGINIERIITLKPDLILAWRETPQRPLEQLQHLGFKVLYIENRQLEDIAANLELLAQYSAHPAQAKAAAADFRQKLRLLRDKYRNLTAKRVFLQFSLQPLLTTSDKTIQNQIVALCHGQNIFADSAIPWPQVGREQVTRRRPQAIITAGDHHDIKVTEAFWRGQLAVPVIALPESEFSRQGPRILQAAEALCQQLVKVK